MTSSTCKAVHGGVDQLDVQGSLACLDELAQAAQEFVSSVEDPGEAE